MKKIFIIYFLIFFCFLNQANSKISSYSRGQEVSGFIQLSNKTKFNLPNGKWEVFDRYVDSGYGMQWNLISLGRIENNELIEILEIGYANLAGAFVKYVDHGLNEIMFKNKYDGCYERPEYYLVEFYQRGSSHNCMVIRHLDIRKELYNPDNPNHRGGNVQLKKYVERNNTEYPPIMLSSSHSYFTRLTGNYWFMLEYNIDPDELGAPISKKTTESSSEYHKGNIDDHPKHKEIMEKWLSISAKKHLEFEEMIQAKSHHLLDLSQYIDDSTSENFGENNLTDELIKLKKLLDDGVITQEEFTKAKKKLLN